MQKILKCPYCGSNNIETAGGENGDPFDRRAEEYICMNCKRTLPGTVGISTDKHIKNGIKTKNKPNIK